MAVGPKKKLLEKVVALGLFYEPCGPYEPN